MDGSDGFYRASAVDQNGSTDGLGVDCYTAGVDGKVYTDFHGDMNYTVTVSTYGKDDFDCSAAPTSTATYVFTVAGTVAVAQPAGPLALRDANGLYAQQSFPISGTPGAVSYQVQYGLNAKVNPDGSLNKTLDTGYFDSATGRLNLLTVKPGAYTVVVRAQSGDYFTPWSAPVHFKVLAPFSFTRSYPDSIGPRYTIRGKLDDGSARGKRVTLAIATGKHGKHFHTRGHAKVNKHGVFSFHVTIHKRGFYRFRYTFKGSGTVARGTVTVLIKIHRILG